jgi:hypothetical protein
VENDIPKTENGRELTEEEIIGEQQSKEYIEKVDLKNSAEVRMLMYVVAAALILLAIAYIASKVTH